LFPIDVIVLGKVTPNHGLFGRSSKQLLLITVTSYVFESLITEEMLRTESVLIESVEKIPTVPCVGPLGCVSMEN
jgi:hypothetical protein